MRLPTIRPLPLAILVVTVVAEVAAVVLSWGLEPAYDTLLYVVFSVGMAGAGALILTRHPRHAIGWLLGGIGVVNALTADLAQGWGLRAAAEGWPGGLGGRMDPGRQFSADRHRRWFCCCCCFPTDGCPSGAGGPWCGSASSASLLAEPGWALDPDTGRVFVHGRNPFAVAWLPTDLLFGIGFAAVVAVAWSPG